MFKKTFCCLLYILIQLCQLISNFITFKTLIHLCCNIKKVEVTVVEEVEGTAAEIVPILVLEVELKSICQMLMTPLFLNKEVKTKPILICSYYSKT